MAAIGRDDAADEFFQPDPSSSSRAGALYAAAMNEEPIRPLPQRALGLFLRA